MGLLSKVASRIRRESTTAGPSSSAGQDERAPPNDYASHQDDELVPDDGNAELPSYDQLFRTEDRDRPIPVNEKLKDPRRRASRARSLPNSVLDLVCDYLLRTKLSLLLHLALLDKSAYEIVIPHLYHTVPIDRGTIHQLLYGIPIPVQGFIFDPTYDGKGKRKEGVYRPDAVVSPASEERKRRCLSHTKRVVVDSVIPDWTTCRSLSILQAPESRFLDTSDDAPGLQYYPMRQPVADWEKTASRTGLLMPNVETMVIRPEAVQVLVRWEKMDKSAHLLPEAMANLCQPTSLEMEGSVMDLILARYTPDPSERSGIEILVRKTIERFGIVSPVTSDRTRRKVKRFTWRGVTSDPLPHIPGCETEIHFTILAANADLDPEEATAMRVEQIREALARAQYYSTSPGRWRFVQPGLLHPDLDEAEEHQEVIKAIEHDPKRPISPGLTNSITFVTLNQALADGLVAPPKGVTPSSLTHHDREVRCNGSVRKSTWDPASSHASRDETRRALLGLANQKLEDPTPRIGIQLARAPRPPPF